MDDERKRPAQTGRLAARTSKRVAEMSDEARAELARELAGRTGTVPDAPLRRAVTVPAENQDPATAASAVRLTAELRRTEHRLERLERSFTRSRYQSGSGGPPSGRYARLLRRADRLERQLRDLG